MGRFPEVSSKLKSEPSENSLLDFCISESSKNQPLKDPEFYMFSTLNIGNEDSHYDTKISIFSFTWADLAAFHKSDKM